MMRPAPSSVAGHDGLAASASASFRSRRRTCATDRAGQAAARAARATIRSRVIATMLAEPGSATRPDVPVARSSQRTRHATSPHDWTASSEPSSLHASSVSQVGPNRSSAGIGGRIRSAAPPPVDPAAPDAEVGARPAGHAELDDRRPVRGQRGPADDVRRPTEWPRAAGVDVDDGTAGMRRRHPRPPAPRRRTGRPRTTPVEVERPQPVVPPRPTDSRWPAFTPSTIRVSSRYQAPVGADPMWARPGARPAARLRPVGHPDRRRRRPAPRRRSPRRRGPARAKPSCLHRMVTSTGGVGCRRGGEVGILSDGAAYRRDLSVAAGWVPARRPCATLRPTSVDTPRGREAGVIPAQSRYGEPPSGAEVRSPTHGACSNLREKGRQDRAPDHLTPPFDDMPEARGPRPDATPPDSPGGSGDPRCPPVLDAPPSSLITRRRPRRPAAAPAAVPARPASAIASPRRRPRRRPLSAESDREPRRPSPRFPVTLTDDEGTGVDLPAAAAEDRVDDARDHRDPVRARRRRPGRRHRRRQRLPPMRPRRCPHVATFDKVDVEKVVALGPTSSSPAGWASPRPIRSPSSAR